MITEVFSVFLSGAQTAGSVPTKVLWAAFIIILCLLAVAIVVFLLHSRRRLQSEEDERERLAQALEQTKKRQRAAEQKLSQAGAEREKAEKEIEQLRVQLTLREEPVLIDESEPAPSVSGEEEKKRAFLATTAVLVGSDYELVSIIDLAADSFEVLGAERSGELTAGEISYTEASRSFANGSCVPKDKERVLWLTSIPGLQDQLKDREFFELTADVSEDGQLKRKIMRFTRFDEEGQLLLATRRDVTDMIEREARGQNALAAALLVRENENSARAELVSSLGRSVSSKMSDVVILSTSAAEESGDERAKEAFRSIRESSSALTDMLRNILDVLELEDGRLSPAAETVYMQDFFSGVKNIAHTEVEGRACRFTQKIGGAMPKQLVFDKLRAERLLGCTLRSAAGRAGESGEVGCTVTCSAPANGRVFIRLVITDNGPAMTKNAVSRAFEPTAEGGGSGSMELYIAKHLAEALDGSLDIESSEGGTTLTVTLPAKEA